MENKEKLKTQINEFVNSTIDKADKEGRLEYFELEIKHHNGDLQLNNIAKERKKVY